MIRRARPDDVARISGLIRDLAAYEGSLSQVVATAGDLHNALFGSDPPLFAHVAEDDGEVLGFAAVAMTEWTVHRLSGLALAELASRAGTVPD